ncbi:MAG: 4Fe-4S ferredoxin [Candidatus Aegiribacteria sp.]|nr:4Fe-4S ferredoxin [Candidatus Aegiribacteria sp.]MBD3294965.1 4Fe-4S ferredoxin [Candidatus Fermentibacteria bacterium]
MKRKIIHIDEERCDGCGICADACHEGAIEIINGKAKLVRDSYCDGLGDCIGPCPRDAISIEEREAEEYDAEAVRRRMLEKENRATGEAGCATQGCPGAAPRTMDPPLNGEIPEKGAPVESHLSSWPVQIALIPPNAPFLRGANLMLTADCVPFALPDIHERFMRGRVTLVGCPKLDDAGAHMQKLAAIFEEAEPKSVTVLRMEVPCCGGLTRMAQMAIKETSLNIPLVVHTVGVRGGVSTERLQ